MEVSEIEPDADRLPLGVVEVGPEEDALPFVEQTRVEVQLAVQEFQSVVGLALSDRQQSAGQSGAEAEAQVVAFVAVRLDGHKGRAVEAHGGGVLAQLAVEAERALAREPMDRLVLEEGLTSAAVEARDVDAAQELDGAVLAAVVGRAEAGVVGHFVHAAGAVLARLVAQTFVDLRVAVVAFVAGQAGARVVVDSVDAGAELARPGRRGSGGAAAGRR